MKTATRLAVGALLLLPLVARVDPSCVETEQVIREADGTSTTRLLRSCRDESGQWRTVPVDDPEEDLARRVQELEQELEQLARETEEAKRTGAELDRQIDSLLQELRADAAATAGLRLWIPWRAHPDLPGVVAGPEPGRWVPAPGHAWLDEAKGTVTWRSGLVHPLEPSYFSTANPGEWRMRGGIGAQIEMRTVPDDGGVAPCVISVVPGRPAERAGLRPDSCFLAVDGAPVSFPPGAVPPPDALEQAIRRIGGAPGSTVALLMRTPDGSRRELAIVREGFAVQAPSLPELAENGYCALLERIASNMRTDFDGMRGELVGSGLTRYDMRNSAHTKKMYTPTIALYRGACQVWDLDDPDYPDEYACHWAASSVEQMNAVWERLTHDVSSCLLPEQYSCHVNQANGRHYCFTERTPGDVFLQWAQRAGNATGEVVLYNHLTIGVQPGAPQAGQPSQEKELEAIRRQQRYHGLRADIARRLTENEEWQSGRIGDGDEYGITVPGGRLPMPVFVFVRLLQADDTVEYTVFHPELSYVRLSLAGIPAPASLLNRTLLAAAAADLERTLVTERGHLKGWKLRPDAQYETLSVSVTAPIPALDGAKVMDDIAWLARQLGSATVPVIARHARAD